MCSALCSGGGVPVYSSCLRLTYIRVAPSERRERLDSWPARARGASRLVLSSKSAASDLSLWQLRLRTCLESNGERKLMGARNRFPRSVLSCSLRAWEFLGNRLDAGRQVGSFEFQQKESQVHYSRLHNRL